MLRAHTVYFSDQSLCKGEWSVLLSIITFMVNAITKDGDDGPCLGDQKYCSCSPLVSSSHSFRMFRKMCFIA